MTDPAQMLHDIAEKGNGMWQFHLDYIQKVFDRAKEGHTFSVSVMNAIHEVSHNPAKCILCHIVFTPKVQPKMVGLITPGTEILDGPFPVTLFFVCKRCSRKTDIALKKQIINTFKQSVPNLREVNVHTEAGHA